MFWGEEDIEILEWPSEKLEDHWNIGFFNKFIIIEASLNLYGWKYIRLSSFTFIIKLVTTVYEKAKKKNRHFCLTR